MERKLETLEMIADYPFKVTTNKNGVTRINQTEQTALKNAMTDIIIQTIQQVYPDLEIVRGANDAMLVIPHNEEGSIYVALDLVTKPLDLDISEYEEAAREKEAKRQERELKKELIAKERENRTSKEA